MLPDFHGLRKQSCDRDSQRSVNPSHNKGFEKSNSSQHFDKHSRTTANGEANHSDSPATKPRRCRKKRTNGVSQYVIESLSEFLALWPHRYDYIYATHPDPATKPEWHTESRHPLSDRLIAQGAYLYGVRPSVSSCYGLIDIDSSSPYHPQREPLALTRIHEALEPLGLVTSLPLTSSDSQGLHVYFPFAEAVPSWQLALAITTLLENAGFKLVPGWLEVFPNRKPFAPDGSFSLFNGHRLPLQQGSYLLNEALEPVASTHLDFVRQWRTAAARNDLSTQVLERIVKQAKRKAYRVSGKAQKFLNDLNAEIEPGWSGPGQTNHILGRITLRSYVFGHVIGAEKPLNGKALVEDIVNVARSLPGFKDFCGHQKEIIKKAKDWALSVESKQRYFPYASGKAFKAKQGPTWNEQQAAEAREHIQHCVIELCQQGVWPEGITPRFEMLCKCHISGETLYKNRDLWHPVFINEQQQALIQLPPNPPVLHKRDGSACAEGATDPSKRTSLLVAAGRNKPNDKGLRVAQEGKIEPFDGIGRNKPDSTACSVSEEGERVDLPKRSTPPEQLALNIQWALQIARSKHREQVRVNQQQYRTERGIKAKAEFDEQLQEWLSSGDPVLETEAERILQRQRKTIESN
ncbi:MAG: hypothetical protein AB8B99_18400 [Phormidesmis sp.]